MQQWWQNFPTLRHRVNKSTNCKICIYVLGYLRFGLGWILALLLSEHILVLTHHVDARWIVGLLVPTSMTLLVLTMQTRKRRRDQPLFGIEKQKMQYMIKSAWIMLLECVFGLIFMMYVDIILTRVFYHSKYFLYKPCWYPKLVVFWPTFTILALILHKRYSGIPTVSNMKREFVSESMKNK